MRWLPKWRLVWKNTRSPGSTASKATGCAGQLESYALVHINHEPAAIEALRIGAPEMIWRSDELCRCVNNRNTALGVTISCTMKAAAAAEQRNSNQ